MAVFLLTFRIILNVAPIVVFPNPLILSSHVQLQKQRQVRVLGESGKEFIPTIQMKKRRCCVRGRRPFSQSVLGFLVSPSLTWEQMEDEHQSTGEKAFRKMGEPQV